MHSCCRSPVQIDHARRVDRVVRIAASRRCRGCIATASPGADMNIMPQNLDKRPKDAAISAIAEGDGRDVPRDPRASAVAYRDAGL